MTEAEWLAADGPMPMLRFLRDSGGASDRKPRLLTCAFCRRIWNLLTDERSREAVEVGERWADGHASEAERGVASAAAQQVDPTEQDSPAIAAYMAVEVNSSRDHPNAEWGLTVEGCAAAVSAVTERATPGGRSARMATYREERAEQSRLVRDIIGNPFRPLTIPTAWLAWNDGAVRRLAEAVYAERAFERMPILADALEEAGCDDAEILAHCRGPGPHTKGCWVLDLLLNRA